MATGGKMISMKKLPVGYRLNPSDEDLVNHHLRRKLLDTPEEYRLIPEFDIYRLPPWDLITKFNELSDLASDGGECFFYHRRGSGKRNSRRTKEVEGFWKVTGEGRKPQATDHTRWLKRILVYHIGKQKSSVKSEWAMHEYENLSDKSVVVCRIHKMKAKKGKGKVGSVSSEAGSNGSPRGSACSEMQIEPHETSIEPHFTPTEEIYPLSGETSFNGCGSGMAYHQLNIYGADETNFKEGQQSILNSQALVASNSDLLSPEELQMLQELSSIDNIQPSSDSSRGGSSIAFHFGQGYGSQQTSLEATRGSATDSPGATDSSDVESWLDSFFAPPPPPYASGC